MRADRLHMELHLGAIARGNCAFERHPNRSPDGTSFAAILQNDHHILADSLCEWFIHATSPYDMLE